MFLCHGGCVVVLTSAKLCTPLRELVWKRAMPDRGRERRSSLAGKSKVVY